MQPEHDYNPECNEEQDPQCKDEEFADLCLDEIEDWDDDFDIEHEPPGCAPVPDMACPLCGLDLSELDTMTPDAHVNRCLDGTGVEPQILPEQTEIPPLLPNVASQLRTGNPISSILGSIRSVITNLPLRPHPPSPSAPTTAAPKPPPKQFKPKVNRPCPFYKKMPGLTSTWSHGLIYCSSITANLVISRLRVDEKWVRRLPMHKPTLVNGVTVTLMDANHCPGSVLFVFDLHSPKRRYLHTGDFRALPDMCLDPVLCQPPNVPIDILYLDTTYSNPRYTFPSQKLVISETVRTINKELGLVNDTVVPPKPAPVKKANIMESWLKRESGNAQKLVTMSTKPAKMSKSAADWSRQMETNRVVICVGTYLIGKERVWMAVAKALRSKVFVQPAKLQILSCLEDQEIIDMLTSDPREAQVHLMHMGSDMSPEPLQEYLDKLSPAFTRLIAIRPTGWTFSGGPKKDSVSTTDITPEQTPTTLQLRPSYTSPMVKIYPVPYSEHSSFNELAGFVRSLNILRIIPTVRIEVMQLHTVFQMPSESHEDEEMSVAEDIHWDETMEMALCYAAIKFKPVGMHKHFRMINLQRHFNKISPRQCTIAELWEKIGTMYNLQALDEREEDVEEEEEEEEEDDGRERDFSFKHSEEFVLPLHEFDHMVTEVFREPSRNPSPSPMRTTRAQREGSQTPSVADSSRASSPEEDDLPRKRRTSRTTKKSDVNETSSPRTSSISASTTRRATRAKAEPAPVTRGRKTVKKS
ncbi:hypothetical protein BG005_002219 [Podila minutissima]|nr:hypothetical protein BG005_002219 [Podila minutissima]